MMIAFFPRNIHWSSLLINSIWPPYRLKGLLRRVYFPWDCINWIKEEQSSDSKDFIIPRDFLKQVSIKVWETTKKQLVYVTKPASSQCHLIFIIKFLFHDVSFLWHELFSGINLGTVSFLARMTGILCLNMIYPGWKIPITSTNLCMNLRQ